MDDGSGATALQRFLAAVTAMTLLGALAGGVVLVVVAAGRAAVVAPVGFVGGAGSGVVTLRSVDDPGQRPFTEPVAVDLAIDQAKMALAPLNAEAARSPHRRGSAADRIIAGIFGHELIRMRDRVGMMRVDFVAELAESSLGIDAVLGDLLDANGDGLDDDGRFTIRTFEGSAVCVSLGVRRVIAAAQSLSIDPVDGTPSSGLAWSANGPCNSETRPRVGSDLRVGTTPGTYGGVRSGDVCDTAALVDALAANEVVAKSWSAVQSIEAGEIPDYVGSLTPVILLKDTFATDHAFENGRIRPGQVAMERGTAVLVDGTGTPRVRCVSGSPLTRARTLTDPVQLVGEPWHGFSLEVVADVPPGRSSVTQFVLVDILSGRPLLREAGAAGVRSELAGPIVAAPIP